MRKLLFLLILVVSQLSAVVAQTISPVTTAEAAGFSTERLKIMDREMNDWVQKGWMNGGVALVIHDGKVAYYKAVGFNDLSTRSALQKDGIFRIASQTKAITSVAIMMLLEEGKFLLDDAVSKYIPAFKKQQVLDKFNAADTTYTTIPAKSEVTIRQLLTHTSGLGYAQIGSRESNAIYAKSNLTAGIGVKNDKLLDAMNRLAKLPLLHQPGEKWTYGLNSDLLGCLVEVISGRTLDEFFRTRIFEPLVMKDTYFSVPVNKAPRLVNMYKEDSTGHLIKATNNILNGVSVTTDYPLLGSTYYSGGAGLSSTIYDYAIFLQMLLNNGMYNGKRLLSRNTVRIMTMNQVGDISIRGDDKFGLGFQVITEKGSGRTPANAGTFSWGGAYSTSYWVDPKEKLVMLFYRQLQNTTHGDLAEKFRDLIYQAIKD
ncbi:MAG: serine hydrolase domain-containing protein [Bacteroidota bacterium]